MRSCVTAIGSENARSPRSAKADNLPVLTESLCRAYQHARIAENASPKTINLEVGPSVQFCDDIVCGPKYNKTFACLQLSMMSAVP